jgi:glycosyltransferase involved in cell wall biosynthesis
MAIPTWNRADHLVVCLASLLAQRYPTDGYKIVVVDDGSTEHTQRVVEAVAPTSSVQAIYVRQPHAGVNAARNLGAGASSGRYLLFVDDDCQTPTGGWRRSSPAFAGIRRRAAPEGPYDGASRAGPAALPRTWPT